MPPRIDRAGVKSHALAGVLCVLACGPPSVEARALWIGGRVGPAGERTLQVYDAGEVTQRALRPISGEVEEGTPLIVELEPAGAGALVMGGGPAFAPEPGATPGGTRAAYLDLAGGRTLALTLPGSRGPEAFAFAAGGGALWWTEGCPGALRVAPLSPRVAPPRAEGGGVEALAWPLPGCAERWGAVGAGAAPVLFAVEGVLEDGAIRPGSEGHVLAIRYPRPDEGYVDAPALTLAREGALPAAPLVRLARARCPAPGPSCGLGVVDPEGEAISVGAAGTGCRLHRWSALEGAALCAVRAEAAAGLRPEGLIAALSPRSYVFREGLIVHLYDWVSGELRSRPLLGDTGELFVGLAEEGRAAVFATTRGVLLRVDEAGLDLIGVEQRACPGAQPPVFSPSGRWVAFTCVLGGADGDDGLTAGEVVRVSAAGMERFQGVPMWALAVDDEGDVLLHSRAGQDFSFELLLPPDPPRNLYVLSSGGELARVDTLEPDPELMRGSVTGVFRWIAARAYAGPVG